MRFELFDGPRSAGSVSLSDGRINLEVWDPEDLPPLAAHFGAARPPPPAATGVTLDAGDLRPADFEAACLALEETLRLVAVPRQVPPRPPAAR